ncbi:hypothetical protein IGI04_042219, partial [Brassica rapa subsp. trilocularis]
MSTCWLSSSVSSCSASNCVSISAISFFIFSFLDDFWEEEEGTSVKVIFFPPFDSEFPEERIRHVLESDSKEWVGGLEYLVGVDRICWSVPIPPFMIVLPSLMTFQRLLLNKIEEDIQLMLSKGLELKSFLGDV